ncbi:hypothetical protein ABPG72_012729 [Tetrahymena utriculariae]
MSNKNFGQNDGDNSIIITKNMLEDKKGVRNVHDPLHKHIELSQILWKIIDTEQFQRLKRIRYMGIISEVYIGATYSVFDISIGACYLAKKYMKAIAKKNHSNQDFKPLQDKSHYDDLICLTQIAALCYNLGQYPYQKIIKNVLKNKKDIQCSKKERSCLLLELILSNTGLCVTTENQENNSNNQTIEKKLSIDEVQVIKDMIMGISKDFWDEKYQSKKNKYPYWIFKIVKNQETSNQGEYKFDIIRLEKLLRANTYIFQKLNSIDYYFIFTNTKVKATTIEIINTQQHTQICDLKLTQINNFKNEKIDLDNKLKYHKAVIGISLKFQDIFESVFDYLLTQISFFSNQNKPKCEQFDLFSKFDDGIVSKIYDKCLTANEEQKKQITQELCSGEKLLKEYYQRKFYKLVFQKYFFEFKEVDKFYSNIESKYNNQNLKMVVLLEKDDLLQKQILKEDNKTFEESNQQISQKGKFLFRIYSDKDKIDHLKKELKISFIDVKSSDMPSADKGKEDAQVIQNQLSQTSINLENEQNQNSNKGILKEVKSNDHSSFTNPSIS